MTHAARMAREDAITDALRAADEALGGEQPTPQALRILAAIRQLRSGEPVRVVSTDRVDYLQQVQQKSRALWLRQYGDLPATGPEHDASATVKTPIGFLSATTWRRTWTGRLGTREAWATEYDLDGEPISIREIREAGLARRPTTRRRRRLSDID